eukprot:CAMPEP_0178383898 /NCGR_PEP_ID=MMETSP0689_2-20121128/7237_1 /TAXON_ID=160604 /ORGANISM="Amphidinium massartii, Strain CS-259" /LENGTH=484 /DNA_ID=CAMNT_0020004129 /DNA_START=306 /DNA_END=1760 /DNA_ORIENTATION=-
MDLLRELSRRAGFTFTVYAVDVNDANFMQNRQDWTWTQLLVNQTKLFDVAMSEWLVTAERMNEGLRSPYAFLDRALLAVGYASDDEETSVSDDLIRWTDPFTVGLWLTFLGISVMTGILYYFLEKDKNYDDLGEPDRGVLPRMLDAQYMGLALFTQGGGFAPATGAGKLLILTYSLVVLLLTTAYTANLAAGLVSTTAGKACASLDECLAEGSTVCVVGRTPYFEWLLGPQSPYSWLQGSSQLVESSADVFIDMAEGKCDVALEGGENVRAGFVRLDVNANCNLQWIGDELLHLSAGWFGHADHHDHCTSVLLDALSIHFVRMDMDGELKKLKDQHMTRISTRAPCPENVVAEEAPQWTVRSMLGGLTIHGICICLVMLRVLVYYWHPHLHLPLFALLAGQKYSERYEDRKAAQKEHSSSKSGAATSAVEQSEAEKDPAAAPVTPSTLETTFPEQVDELMRSIQALQQCWEAESTLRQRSVQVS